MSKTFFEELMSDYGTSVKEKNQVSLGKTETGEEITFGVSMMGHTIISGMTRMGKSREAKKILGSINKFASVAVYTPKVSDFVEFEKISMVTSEEGKMGALIRRTIGEMERRNQRILAASRKAGKPVQCDEQPIIIMIDEFQNFKNVSEEGTLRSLNRLAAEGAGLNIYLYLIAQVATKKLFNGGLRDNAATMIAFRSQDAYASRMAVGDRTAEFLEPGKCIVVNGDKRVNITNIE